MNNPAFAEGRTAFLESVHRLGEFFLLIIGDTLLAFPAGKTPVLRMTWFNCEDCGDTVKKVR